MGFVEAIKSFYQNYATFSGRSSRSAYWWVALYTFIVFLIPYLFLYFQLINYQLNGGGEISVALAVWCGLFWLANLLPNLALSVRRMHDIGKGGGWIFINCVPLIGGIWFLVLTLMPSEPYENRFGLPEGQYA